MRSRRLLFRTPNEKRANSSSHILPAEIETLIKNVYIALLFFALPALLFAQAKRNSQPGTLVFIHVTVIDATGAPSKPDQAVVITGDRITALGKTGRVNIPKGAQLVDARGKFLIPGLWDMHVHISYKDFLTLFIANGVTGVRDMGGSHKDSAQREQWLQQITKGTHLGPRVVAAGIIVDGPEPAGRPDSINVANESEGRQAVHTLRRRGADFIKVYSMLTREAYFSIADEAKKQSLPFAGHVPMSVSATEASDAGQKSIEHFFGVLTACSTDETELMKVNATSSYADFTTAEIRAQIKSLDTYDKEKCTRLIERFVKNGTWMDPTLTAWLTLASSIDAAPTTDSRLKYIPLERRKEWEFRRTGFLRVLPTEYAANSQRLFQGQLDLVRAMRRAGVNFLAGTDTAGFYTFPGFSLHDELALLVKAGLTPMEALQAATQGPAKYFGLLDSFGTIERGKIADLVLLEADPLTEISNTQKIAAVIVGGKFISKAKLQQMLAGVEAAASKN